MQSGWCKQDLRFSLSFDVGSNRPPSSSLTLVLLALAAHLQARSSRTAMLPIHTVATETMPTLIKATAPSTDRQLLPLSRASLARAAREVVREEAQEVLEARAAPVELLPITVSVEVKDGLAPPPARAPIPVRWSASGTLSASELDRPSMVAFKEYCCLDSYRTYLSSSTCFFALCVFPPRTE
jgi:hypothetical protein